MVRITSYHICLPPVCFASSSSLQSGQGGLNTSLMKGLTAQAASYHQMGPNLTADVLLPQQTHGDQRVLLLCPRILPGPTQIRDRPQSNTLDEPLGGRKRGPDRVMGLTWGFMESTHHTARTLRRQSLAPVGQTGSSKAPRPHSLASGPSLQTVSEACPPREPSRILGSQPQPQLSSYLGELGLKRNMVFTARP